MPDELLREIYYRSEKEFLNIEQKIFGVGDSCDDIFIVISGVIEITLSDGKKKQHLDMMGRGSIIGMSNILFGEKWAYYATAMSERGTIIFRLKKDVLKLMAKVYNPLQLALETASGYLTNEKPMA